MMNMRKFICMFLIIAIVFVYGCSDEIRLSAATSASPTVTSASPVPTEDNRQLSEQNYSSWENEVNLEEIPELGYRNIDLWNTENYICYRDILILDSDIYKKVEGKYKYQKKNC